MTYSQLFANAGQPMPAQFTQFANIEIPAEQLPAYLQQYPPVAQPQAPAAPAPAAVPPAAAVPGAPVATAAPAAPTVESDINDPDNNWRIIKRYDADTCAKEGVIIADLGGSPSKRYPGMTQYSAIVKGMVVRGEAIPATEVYTSSIFQDGRVTGYHTVAECQALVVSENPKVPGDYRYKLQISNLDKRAVNAKVVKLKPSMNWAALLATDADAED